MKNISVEKSKIDEAFDKWVDEQYEKEPKPEAEKSTYKMMFKDCFMDSWKQSRVDLAEDIHVALTFAECGLKDKDYALKLSREIIDIELDDEYWNNPK